MKIKSKIIISKNKRSKIFQEDEKIISKFEKEIIEDLYKFASKGKSKGAISLTELEYPEEYKTKVGILNKLRNQKIILKYKLLKKPEEVETFPAKPKMPSKLEIETNPDVLLHQIPENYDHHYLYNVSIEFNPQRILKYCKPDLIFKDKESALYFGEKKCKIPLQTSRTADVSYEFLICKFLYTGKNKDKTDFSWDEIDDYITQETQGEKIEDGYRKDKITKRIKDTINRINKKTETSFGSKILRIHKGIITKLK